MRKPTQKLTEPDVLTIRTRHANGATQARLARDYNVTQATISCVVRGITWTNVGGPIAETDPTHVTKKFTAHDALTIRVDYATGHHTVGALARRFNVTTSHVTNVLRGRRWPDAGGPLTHGF